MRKVILDYLKAQSVGVIAIEMLDCSPHAATVHFANTDAPFVFFFETSRTYRKAEALLGRDQSRASFVVGTSEEVMKTLQLDGTVRLLQDVDMETFKNVYFSKFPDKKEKANNNPDVIFFTFTPTWWRYTDWTQPEGKLIIYSENIDVLDAEGNKTGEVRTIDDIHAYGLWHSSSRVWIMNSKDEILLQHRDKSSVEFPERWDVSAAGHISAGDDSIGTAIGEVKEELGLTIDPSELMFLSRMKKEAVSSDGKYIDNSFENIYLVKKNVEIDSLKMQKGEVQNLKWVSIDEFKKMVLNESSELVPHHDEYELLLSKIA